MKRREERMLERLADARGQLESAWSLALSAPTSDPVRDATKAKLCETLERLRYDSEQAIAYVRELGHRSD